MNNRQLFPFERNRYYAGKMLASMDFRAEQLYMNNKRRFLNSMLYGPGVLCGLGVSALDDLTVLVDGGAALDDGGREIILNGSVARKLSAIDGFETIRGEQAQLRIRYVEEAVHPVFAMGDDGQEESYECNRIREGYQLFLAEGSEERRETPAFLQEAVFLEQEDFRVLISVPKAVCRGRLVRLRVTAVKCSGAEKPLSFEGILQFPAFVTKTGEHELHIDMRDIFLEQGEQYRKDYWIVAQQGRMDTGSILWKRGSGQAFVGEYDVPVREDASLETFFCNLEPEQMALSQTAQESLESVGTKDGKGILLAEIRMFRTEGAYVIASVTDGRRYLAPPARSEERQQYMACFAETSGREGLGTVSETVQTTENTGRLHLPRMTSGTLEIPLDVNMKRGDICFSEEILHGLGQGEVFVQVGVACLEETDVMGSRVKSTIYGDSDLFREQDHSWVKTAVKVYHEKGSFQVAARLEGEQRSIVLLLNWVAMRFHSGEESRLAGDCSEMSIVPRMPTVRLEAGKSCLIDVLFCRMQPCRLVYELTESGSGRISQDGIYTAPAGEGLYEIHIYCADTPQIDTYAYVIVE